MMRLVLCSLVVLLIAGCTTTVVAPASPSHPTTVLITDYGKHSSLLLPDPQGGLIEYAFGDYNWFALGHNSPIDAIVALVHSSGATLGRRWIFSSADAPNLASQLDVKALHSLSVDGERVKQLRQRLDYEFDLHIDGMIYSPNAELYVVRCDEQYDAFHNCNHVTGEWLRELGATTHGWCMFADYDVVPAAGK